MKSEELAGEHHPHHHGHHRHHRRRHRHRRFHVRPEAQGIGYWKYLGMPPRGGRKTGEAGVDPEDETAEEQERQGGSFWTAVVIVVCAMVLVWLLGEQFLSVLWRLVPH
jgi:hypothetical protein